MPNIPRNLSPSRESNLKQLVQALMDDGWLTTCTNCCDWDEPKEMCMKFKVRPPAKVIVVGCEHHSDIPF